MPEVRENGRFKSVDYTGMRFGRLVVLGISDKIYIDIAGEDISPFDFFEKQLTIMKDLFYWAESLPFKSE